MDIYGPSGKRPWTLILDIETAPIRAAVWRIWKENIGINQIDKDWFILCWAAKWLGAEEVMSDALFRHRAAYKASSEDDSLVMRAMWRLMDAADVVVAHNGNRFDIPKLNCRFLSNDMPPPSPYTKVDTFQIAKSRFGFTSNKLDFLARSLGMGCKHKVDFDLWSGCLSGDRLSWSKMVEYNKQDVKLLEKVYLKLRPWTTTHPNFALYVDDDKPRCTKCGSDNLVRNGNEYTGVSKFQRYKCKDCGASLRGRYNVLDRKQRKNLLVNCVY